MGSLQRNVAFLTNHFYVRDEFKHEFADWQARFNMAIAAFPGFVSLEILSVDGWSLVQRFHNDEFLAKWKNSSERIALLDELKKFDVKETREIVTGISNVTEVFVTQVEPENVEAYQKWMSKIHQVEATFPGFKGVYVQSPSSTGGKNWITLLQFDTAENLDRWLTSPERAEVLEEAKSLIHSLDNHRLTSPFGSWFGSIAKESGALPPVWKQTLIILLVLFPIVMLELMFLMPKLGSLPMAVSTFIGNAISVSLISWPCMPIAVFFLNWWLSPRADLKISIAGTFLIILFYILEIIIFLNFT